jgi:hypothetical protein
LAFAPAASDVRFSDCVKHPSALALERRLRCDPSHAGVMPYGPAESWLPRLSATPYPPARRLRRLDTLALCCDDVRTFSPERGLCQIKILSLVHARCGREHVYYDLSKLTDEQLRTSYEILKPAAPDDAIRDTD